MRYREFGKTGKQISQIAFGGMRFLPEEYKKSLDPCADIILRAVELGINYFDTAPGYCDDYSEKIYGHAFAQMKEIPYISTKCGLWNAKTADEAYARIIKSLETMNIEKITFYNLWCIKHLDEYQQMIKPGGIYEGILRAKNEGLIEYICCSSHMDGNAIADVIADGKVEAVTLNYNALNFAYRKQALDACYTQDIGVVVMNPLGGGMIPRHADKFVFLKQSPEETIVQAAIRFLIGQKEVSAALPGPESIAQLEECVSAADFVYEITPEMLSDMAKHLSANLNTVCTSCAYCDECPVDIPVPKFLDSYNEALLGKDIKQVKEHLQSFWGIDAADAAMCIHCGKCEQLCTQKLPIMQRLDEIAGK